MTSIKTIQITKTETLVNFETACDRRAVLDTLINTCSVDIFVGGQFDFLNPETNEVKSMSIKKESEYLKCFIDIRNNKIKYVKLTWSGDHSEVVRVDKLEVNFNKNTLYFLGFLRS